MQLLFEILSRVGVAAIFFVLGRITPSWAETRYCKRRRAEAAQRLMEGMLKKAQASGHYYPFGQGFGIENVEPFFFCAAPETAMTYESVTGSYVDTEKPLDPELAETYRTYLRETEERFTHAGQTFDDNKGYSLNGFTIRRDDATNHRVRGIDLAFSPTIFSKFATLNLALDKPRLEQYGKPVSIRAKYDLHPGTLDCTKLSKIPLHLRFGTDTVVVTKDDQLVLPVRSVVQGIAPGSGPIGPYSVGTLGEGMLRPADSSAMADGQQPSPFLTAKRALKDELNLDDLAHYDPSRIRLLGLYFDYGRYQPMAVFTVKLNITAGELEEIWRGAADAHEHAFVYYLANDLQAVDRLYRGKLSFDDRPLMLASNHVNMALFLGMLYYHSYSEVRKVFSA